MHHIITNLIFIVPLLLALSGCVTTLGLDQGGGPGRPDPLMSQVQAAESQAAATGDHGPAGADQSAGAPSTAGAAANPARDAGGGGKEPLSGTRDAGADLDPPAEDPYAEGWYDEAHLVIPDILGGAQMAAATGIEWCAEGDDSIGCAMTADSACRGGLDSGGSCADSVIAGLEPQ